MPDATAYISQFVAYLPIEVKVNGRLISRQPIENSVPPLAPTWSLKEAAVDLGDGVKANIELFGAVTGDVRISLNNIECGGQKLDGNMILRQGLGVLRTFRSGFGLATTSLISVYQFGGVADFLFLQPTAGREALTTESMQALQRVVTRIDDFVSLSLSRRPECNDSQSFVAWAFKDRRFDLCSNLRVRIEPGDSLSLREIRDTSLKAPMLLYSGNDPATVKHASEEKPIVLPSP